MNARKLNAVNCGISIVLVLLIAVGWLLKCYGSKVAEAGQDTSIPGVHQGGRYESPQSEEQSELPESLESLIAQLNTAIKVYGKVVDQLGEPVTDAKVTLNPINRLENSYGKKVVVTSENGTFSAEGLYGKSLGISAEKKGYLQIPPMSSLSSTAMLDYARSGEGKGNPHSVPSNPIVLELWKIGPTEPMVHVDKKRWELPIDGTPHMIALNSKEGQGKHQIEFRFSSNWNKLPMDNEINSKKFDWSFELRVSGGGFVWDESDAKFEAPAVGYKEVVRYEYPATMPRDEWKRTQRGRYFVRFPDNTWGRIHFEIDGGSDRRPLYMQSWLSLTPGSRNLATETMIINVMESKEPSR